MPEESKSTSLLAPPREKSGYVMMTTWVAFVASAFFMVTTVLDVVGARDENSDVQNFKAAGDEGSSVINFNDDLMIALIGFGACVVITLICLIAFNRRFYYVDLEGENLLLRKTQKGRAKSLPLKTVESVEIDDAEFDDALAQAANPDRKAARDVVVLAAGKRLLIHAHSQEEAEALRDAIAPAKA